MPISTHPLRRLPRKMSTREPGKLLSYRDTITDDGAYDLTVIGRLARSRARAAYNADIVAKLGLRAPPSIGSSYIHAWNARRATLRGHEVKIAPFSTYLARETEQVLGHAEAQKFRFERMRSDDATPVMQAAE